MLESRCFAIPFVVEPCHDGRRARRAEPLVQRRRPLVVGVPFDAHLLDLRMVLQDRQHGGEDPVARRQDARAPRREFHLIEDHDLVVLYESPPGTRSSSGRRSLGPASSGHASCVVRECRPCRDPDQAARGIRSSSDRPSSRRPRPGRRLRRRARRPCRDQVAEGAAVRLRIVGLHAPTAPDRHLASRGSRRRRDRAAAEGRGTSVGLRVVRPDAALVGAGVLGVGDPVAVAIARRLLHRGGPLDHRHPARRRGAVASREPRAAAQADLPVVGDRVVRAEEPFERRGPRREDLARVRDRCRAVDLGADEEPVDRRSATRPTRRTSARSRRGSSRSLRSARGTRSRTGRRTRRSRCLPQP